MNTGFTRRGYTISRENFQEVINETDLYGDAIVDTVYRGGATYITFISRVYKAGSIHPFWPWSSTPATITFLGEMWTAGAPVARLGSGLAFALVLTAVTATPAAALPATLTAYAYIAPGYNGELLFDSRCRDVPVRLICQAVDDDVTPGVIGTGRLFTLT